MTRNRRNDLMNALVAVVAAEYDLYDKGIITAKERDRVIARSALHIAVTFLKESE